ncbi:MAG: hypothetical protein K2X82_06090 [Gemmataceae bacterium]|nr:hypothetical protein [Gemmataceae bacterium]
MPHRYSIPCSLLLLLGGTAVSAEPRLPVLTDDDAWKRLPGAPARAEPLPVWARAWAGMQPLTTARMLELDALHRTGDRLDGRFRAAVRWSAADANRSPYGRAMAAADFGRAGGDPAELPDLVRKPDRLPLADRLAADFARDMMLNAAGVTDDEVRRLIEVIGEERMMALVALVAHASFQDRLFLALAVEPEAGGVPPPVAARFARPKPPAPPPPAKDQPAPAATAAPPPAPSSAEWLDLRKGLEGQKLRPGRIRVPSVAAVHAKLGPDNPALWQAGIIWSRVAYGYQPELTTAWFDASAAAGRESALDPAFRNVVFWQVTEALKCFY